MDVLATLATGAIIMEILLGKACEVLDIDFILADEEVRSRSRP